MTRGTFQKGYVFSRQRKRGKVHVIRYRVRTAEGTWKHRAETVDSPRRKDAERVLADRLRDVNGGTKLPSNVTFADFAGDQWEAYLKQNLKPSTQAAHHSNLRAHLLPAFGGWRLAEISALLVFEFLKEKRRAGLSPKTLLNLYLLLHKMLNLAVDLELIPASPMRRVPKPKIERVEKPTLTPAQVRAVIECVPEKFRGLFMVLYFTGLRIGEVLGLKWKDVDFGRMRIYVRRSVWHRQEQSPKSRRSIRAKLLLGTVARALARDKELSCYTELEDYIFTNGARKPLDPDDLRKRVLYAAMEKVGIKRTASRAYGFHLFRHSAGSQMHEITGDLKQTQSFLGHSGVAVTGDVYVHLQPDAEVEPMRKLEEAVFPELCSTVLKTGVSESSSRVN